MEIFDETEVLLTKAEELGWGVDCEGEMTYCLSHCSPAGQDFGFSIYRGNSPEEFLRNLYEVYKNFDCSEEAYIWLDNTGHGKNGAPRDMKDVYEDMKACENMIYDLHKELYRYYEEKPYSLVANLRKRPLNSESWTKFGNAAADKIEELEEKLKKFAEENRQLLTERDEMASKINQAYSLAWYHDVPSPNVPEYVELHEAMTIIMQTLKGETKDEENNKG